MNAYEMLELLRDNVGEKIEKHWKDRLLLRTINIEHNAVGRKVSSSVGDWLLKKSAALTSSNSIITLPSDCLYPAYIEEVSSGRVIDIRGTIRERSFGRQPVGSFSIGNLEAYFFGKYLEVNQSGYENQVYVWYQQRVPHLHAGECGNGTGETSIVFEAKNWPSGQDDYYNGMVVEVRDKENHVMNTQQEITDYVGSTFTATVAASTAAPAVNDLYGTVSPLPEELLNLVLLKATVRALSKPSSTFEKELFMFWKSLLKDAKEEADDFLTSRLSGSSYVRIVEGNY